MRSRSKSRAIETISAGKPLASPVTCYLGLGSNLGDRHGSLDDAVNALGQGPITVRRVSRIYQTEPVGGPAGQPWFLNQVVEIETALSPRELLDHCLSLEDTLGRDRSHEERWGPRTIDIDLLLYGSEVIEEEGLIVPHPRLAARAFVLRPLAELDPALSVPGLGRVDQLARRAGDPHGVIALSPHAEVPSERSTSQPASAPARHGRGRVVIVGAGRVGESLAAALYDAGHEVVVPLRRGDPLDVVSTAAIVVIAVPDDSLREVVASVLVHAELATLIVHTCGSVGLEVLREHGDAIGVLHPATPVARKGSPFEQMFFGISGTDGSLPELIRLVEQIRGRWILVDDKDRPRYHAALVHLSNHMVAATADAASMIGNRVDVLIPLLEATVANIERLGPASALTGPIARGDAATVATHLEGLPSDLVEVYVASARRALALAVGSGRLTEEGAARVRALLDATG